MYTSCPTSSEEFKIASHTQSAPYHAMRLKLAVGDQAAENNILAFVEEKIVPGPVKNSAFLAR